VVDELAAVSIGYGRDGSIIDANVSRKNDVQAARNLRERLLPLLEVFLPLADLTLRPFN
jgi:hypothetical protein